MKPEGHRRRICNSKACCQVTRATGIKQNQPKSLTTVQRMVAVPINPGGCPPWITIIFYYVPGINETRRASPPHLQLDGVLPGHQGNGNEAEST
jgi:hypothetical protein